MKVSQIAAETACVRAAVLHGCIKLPLLSPRGTSGERTEERAAPFADQNRPPLPSPLLHRIEEREKFGSSMQPCLCRIGITTSLNRMIIVHKLCKCPIHARSPGYV